MWHVWHLFSTLITQKNLLFVGLTNWLGAAFISFFISFFSLTPIPKPTEPREKKKTQCEKKKKEEEDNRKTKHRPSMKEKKKKKKTTRVGESKRSDWIWLLFDRESLKYVCIYQNVIITLFP